MPGSTGEVFRFGAFELEPGERRLLRRGEPVALTPKVFDLLVLMVRGAGRLFTKDELMSALWPGRFVMESNLTKHVWLLRKALEEDREGAFIQTAPKVGYRFVAPVTSEPAGEKAAPPIPVPAASRIRLRRLALERAPRWATAGGALVTVLAVLAALWLHGQAAPAFAAGDRPAVSLAGFQNLSASPRDGWIGPALAETLGTELGLDGRLRVVPGELARGAARGLPTPGAGGYAPASLASLRRRLGADYVLTGGYLVSGEGDEAAVRLDFALQDTRGGPVVMVSRSGWVAELPALVTLAGTELRRRLVGAPGSAAEARLALGVQPPSAEVMRRIGLGLDALRRYDAAGARDQFLEAVAQAPAYAPAYSYLAQAWSALGYQAKARAAAEQAAAHAAGLPEPARLGIMAESQEARFDWPGAARSLRRLIALSPGDPEPRLRLIDALISGGEPGQAEAALADLRRLPRHGPQDPRVELAAARLAGARDVADAAADHARRALRQARANGEPALAAEAEAQLAIAAGARDPKAAGALFGAALGDYRRLGNPHGEAWVEQNLGNLLFDRDPAGARAAYERALARYQAIGDLGGTAAAYSDLARVLWSDGDRDAAETAASHALALRRQTGDRVGEAWALAALAVGASDESASDTVIAQFRQAIALDAATGAAAHRAFSLLSLSDVLRMRGDLGEAALTCAEARAVDARIGDPAARHGADFQCAQIALDQGDVAAAEAGLRGARQGADAMTLGNISLLEGQIAAGERRFSQAALQFEAAGRFFASGDMVPGEVVADSLRALAEAALGHGAARDAAAARARALRGRITERQEVLAADIALAQLRGDAAALEALSADAMKRRWLAWSLEARLAEQGLPSRSGEAARRLRQALGADARRHGFGWVLHRLSNGAAG